MGDYLQKLGKKLQGEPPNLHFHTLEFRFKCETFIIKSGACIAVSFL